MRRKGHHIIFFALLQLLVFITPTVIKLIHHHEVEQFVLQFNSNKSVAKDHDQCPICHFEFVNFVSSDHDKLDFDIQNTMVLLCLGHTSPLSNTPLQFFSNRAPPSEIA